MILLTNCAPGMDGRPPFGLEGGTPTAMSGGLRPERSAVRNPCWFLALFSVAAAAAPAGPPASVPKAPVRVVSCTVASDEVALDLLTRAGHPERLKGVSTLAADPRYGNVPVPKDV